MAEQLVKLEEEGAGVVRILLNDPSSRNAMSAEMAAEFESAVTQVSARNDVRVVVLTGTGEAFSGGGHLNMLLEKTKLSKEKNRELMELFYSQFLSVRKLRCPVIAAINGHAVGAGLCLALACDIRIANNKAKLGLNFVHLGLHPGMGATYFLPRLIGPARAAELLYAGQIISAEQAAAIGLINKTLPPETFQNEVESLTRQIAGAGPQAVRALKESLRSSSEASLDACLQREAYCQALDYTGREFLEGISAAQEKRKPDF